MSPESSSSDHEHSQTPFPSPLARSVLARTSWVQHALSPWIQRWLAGTLGRGPGRAAAIGQQPWVQRETALTAANTQWLVKRVQRIAERQTLPTWTSAAPTAELHLAGARPAQATAEPTPEPIPEAPGFKPFDSFTDFVKAVEESRVSGYQPTTSASDLAPETHHERARHPKLSASVRQLPPSREQGPYSRRFTSFADFVHALEETRQRESELAAQPPAQGEAHGAPAPTTRIRPVSKIEELPPHISTVPEQAPALSTAPELPSQVQSAPVELAEATPSSAPPHTQPAELLEHYPAAELSLDMAVEAQDQTPSPAARPDRPAMQVGSTEHTTMPSVVEPHPRAESPSPTEQAAEAIASPQPGLAAPRAPVTRPAPMPTTPPVQRQAIEVEPAPVEGAPHEPAQPHVAPQAPAPIEPEIEAEPVRPEARVDAQRNDVVQRQAAAAEPAPWPSTAIEPPIKPPSGRGTTPPPARPHMPVAKRQMIEARPAPTPTIESAQHHVEPPPVRREALHLVTPSEQQATEGEPVPRPSAAIEPYAAPTSMQTPEPIESPVEAPRPAPRRVPLAPSEPQAVEARPVEPPIESQPVRRETTQLAPSERQATGAGPIEPTSEPPIGPLLPRSATPLPARPDLPLAQRQAAPIQPAPRPGAAVEPQAEAQTPAPVESSVETPATPLEMPQSPFEEVQRQATETEPAPRPTAVTEPPIEPPLPRSATPLPARPDLPVAQRQTAPVQPAPRPGAAVEPQAEAQTPAPVEPSAETPATQVEVPPFLLREAQRQATETELALPSTAVAEPPVEPPLPRSATPPAARPAPQPSAAVEPSVETPATRVEKPHFPLWEAQRQVTETEPALRPTAITEPPIEPPSPSMPPLSPQVQRQVAGTEPIPTVATEPPIEPPLPSTPTGSATRPDARIERPMVQRHTTAASPAPTSPSEIEPPAETPASQLELPRSAMQRAVAEAAPAPTAAIEPRDVGRRASAETPSARPDVQIEPPLVQRRIFEPEPTTEPPSATSDEHDFTLGTQVFARRAASQRLTTTAPPDLPLTRPAPLERTAQHETVSMPRAPAARPEAVTRATIPATSTVIQRTPIEAPAIPSGEGFIQRVESTPPQAAVPTQAPQPDLDDLARKIYPLIKRMLSIERERRAF